MLNASCPDCGMKYRLRDDLDGSRIRCKECGRTFVVGAREDERPSRRRKDDDEDRGAIRSAEDRPRSRRRDDDGSDDDRDRPQRRRTRRDAESSGAGLMWGLIAGGIVLVLVAVGGVISWAVFSASAPPQPPQPIVQVGGPDGMKIQIELPKQFPIKVGPGGFQFDPNGGAGEADWTKDRFVKRKVQLKAKGHENRTFLFPAQVTEQAVVGAMILKIDFNNPKPPSQQFDRFDMTNKRVLGTVQKDELGTEEIAGVSPDGSMLLVRTNGKYGVWSFQTRQFVARDLSFAYGRKDPFRVNEIRAAWVGFLDNQRILAVYDDGAADAWTFANAQRSPLYVVPQDNSGVVDWRIRPGIDAFSHVPKNFRISSDRGTLALWNAQGFHLIDVRTGQKRTTAPAENPSGEAIDPTCVAFNGDGSQLVAILGLNMKKGGFERKQYFVRWDARTGQKILQIPLAPEVTFDFWQGLTYWGPNHLAVVNQGSVHVLRADTGAYVAKGTPAGADGRFFPPTGDGTLNLMSGQGPFAQPFLLAVDCPEAQLAANRQFTLNYQGLANP